MKVQNHNPRYGRKNTKNDAFNALFRTILLLVIVLILARSGYAAVFKDVTIIDHLESDSSMTETINLTLSENIDNIFALTLPAESYNIMVDGESYSNNSLSIPLNCTECTVSIIYKLDNTIKQYTKQYTFYRTLNFPQIPVQQEYIIYLPAGYSINVTDQSTPSVVPKPTEISTDGQHIIIRWKEANPQMPKQYLVIYYGAEETESFFYVLANDVSHATVVLFGLLLLVIGFVAGYVLNKTATKKWLKNIPTEVKQHIVPSSLLSPDEKKVVHYLKEKNSHKEPVNQKDIGKALNWSKSKVSAVLSNLYYKKIIDREKFGRNYKVKLVRDVE